MQKVISLLTPTDLELKKTELAQFFLCLKNLTILE